MAPMEEASTRTAYRTCPLCEAGCGLEITLKGDEVGRIRGDRDDVFSHGYICPKGSTLKQLHEDPDRLRTPLIKRDGRFVEATWDEAFAEIDRRYHAGHRRPRPRRGGRLPRQPGRPQPSARCSTAAFAIKALGTKNVFSASTVDQRPKEISAALMFGGGLTVPVPDIDRTDYLLMLGANPYASNGSLATAPDWPGRLEALIERGGKLVVVDPRRSRTAEEASEHVSIRPGTDALLLMAMVQVLFADDLVDLGPLADFTDGLDDVRRAAAPFTPEAVATATGIDADTIRRLAHELAAAPTAAVYGRIGTTTQEFGTIAELAGRRAQRPHRQPRPPGRRDVHEGGRRRVEHAGHASGRARPRLGRRTSRVRGLPETMGELPGGRAWPRRSTRRARARSGRWSPSPATRCCPRRTAAASTPRWPRSTSWCRSTST